MTEQERIEFNKMKKQLALLNDFIEIRGNLIILKKTVQINGKLNADRVYTQRSGSYVELTT